MIPKQRLIVTALFVAVVISPVRALEVDNDHDGVPDSRDRCANTAQLKKLSPDFKYAVAVNQDRLKPGSHAYPVDQHGCEFDTDSDGVVNSGDYCPEDSEEALSMGVAANGCPKHSDTDGIPDYRDKCPNTPANVKTDRFGCEEGQGGLAKPAPEGAKAR